MKDELLPRLRCPSCRSRLAVSDAVQKNAVIEQGRLRCEGCGAQYPIHRGVPRFVPVTNYSASFGLQWNLFRRTQLDSASGLTISRDRFFASTNWSPRELSGRRVLDVGCGSGRFAEIALSAGAHVVAVDYSGAVDAAADNLSSHPRFDVIQGDVYQLPFAEGAFDFVYCLGVLQHTPDVKRAFMSLVPQLAPGGRLAVDLYPKLLRNAVWPKYWLRPMTARLPPARLLALVQRAVPILLPISRVLGRAPGAGRWLRHAVPVVNYEGIHPLSEAQLREWAVLDTFDMLSPVHDHPQTAATIESWLHEARLADVEVLRIGHLVGRGSRRA